METKGLWQQQRVLGSPCLVLDLLYFTHDQGAVAHLRPNNSAPDSWKNARTIVVGLLSVGTACARSAVSQALCVA